jgi:hypothetical protein
VGDMRWPDKELRPLVRAARLQGWSVSQTGRGHVKFLPKDKSMPPVFCGVTRSDVRTIHNIIAALRRSGLDV